MKGIVYCRVSSQDQVRGTSLDGQKQACLEYAATKGIEVVKIFVERGESATAANRTELIKALDFCREQKDKIGAFIVWKIDRFARNAIDHYGLQAQLIKYSTVLFSVTEPIDDSPIGKMTEAMLAGYAQFENDIRKQRCEGGMQRKIKEGIRPWMPPLGYLQSKKRTDKRKTLPDEIDPERFTLVQWGLKEYSKGTHSIESLTRAWNERGLKTRTGKPIFKQIAERLLRDKYYAGILVNPWTGEEFKGLHKPMLTLEEFDQIQFYKNYHSRNRSAPRANLNPDFPLRRLLNCVCGYKMTGSWATGRSQRYPYYVCHNRACEYNNKGIIKSEIEKQFIKLLKMVSLDVQLAERFEHALMKSWKKKQGEISEDIYRYDRELKKLEERRARLLEMRMNGEIGKEEYAEAKEAIENQLTGFRISHNESKINELDVESAIAYATKFLQDLARNWEIMNVEQKQRFQKMIFPNGIIFDKSTGKYGTAVLSPLFTLSRDFQRRESHLVAGGGIEPPTSRL